MTKKEITEIFSVMMLAYPRAEMFKGGIAKLGPTITLWARCLEDIDFWTGQQAVIRVCKECTFPPTIAEFRAAAEAVNEELEARASGIFGSIRSGEALVGSMDAFYKKLAPDDEIRMVIDALGGPQNLISCHEFNGKTVGMWNISAITKAAKTVIRKSKQLPRGDQALLGEKGGP